MNKFDKEDKTLLAIILAMFILSVVLLITGFCIYENKWDTYFLLLTISSVVFFLLSILSLVVKKHKEKNKE